MHGLSPREPDMKTSEIMTWAGPLPPSFAEAFVETSDAREIVTFAGPLPPSGTDAVEQNELSIEPIMWAGLLPPDSVFAPKAPTSSEEVSKAFGE
jgi:hypothetical protein